MAGGAHSEKQRRWRTGWRTLGMETRKGGGKILYVNSSLVHPAPGFVKPFSFSGVFVTNSYSCSKSFIFASFRYNISFLSPLQTDFTLPTGQFYKFLQTGINLLLFILVCSVTCQTSQSNHHRNCCISSICCFVGC